MQNRNFIRIVAVVFALICLYQLSFTFVVQGAEEDAARRKCERELLGSYDQNRQAQRKCEGEHDQRGHEQQRKRSKPPRGRAQHQSSMRARLRSIKLLARLGARCRASGT